VHTTHIGLVGTITTDDADRAKEREVLGSKSFDKALAELGRSFGWHDFSQYDLDAPFPEVAHLGARVPYPRREDHQAGARKQLDTAPGDRERADRMELAVRWLAADRRR
jgi:hypothetical protein